MDQWIKEECAKQDFGDQRLVNRYGLILEKFSKSPQESIPSSCKGWRDTNGAYRFFRNPKVNSSKILGGHIECTKERLSGIQTLLLIQDTTSLDYTGNRSTNKLGHLEESSHRGFLLHPTIVETVDRINLGILDFELWTRDIETLGKCKEHKQKPIEDKESYRWLKSFKTADALARQYPEKRIISISDREGDIFELFKETSKDDSRAEIIIRASQNRRLVDEKGEINLLWSVLENSAIIGEKELTLPPTHKREGRDILLQIKTSEITIKAPYRKNQKLNSIKLYAVLAEEKEAANDTEKIEWLLLTTLNIQRLEQAIEVLDFYTVRWQIEIYFHTLKGGCQVEELQLEDVENLENAISIYMIIAWRIQYLLMLGRQCPDLPADVVFTESECRVIYVAKELPLPDKVPTLNEMIKMTASLGGYLGRKHDGPPGVKTFWIGLTILWHYSSIFTKIIERKDVYNR